MAGVRQIFISKHLFRKYFEQHHLCKCQGLRNVVTGNPKADQALNVVTGGRIEGWLQKYENLVGLTEVRLAQEGVLEAEKMFQTTQAKRRDKQQQLLAVQMKLKELSAELEKFQRGDDRYLALVTEENRILKDDNKLRVELEGCELEEREHFALLSSAVRESHERERTRTERTKYWSIIGSIVGAAIGIIGTSVNNYLRMRELRSIVKESAEGGVEMKGIIGKLSETMSRQHNQIHSFVTDLKTIVGTGPVVHQSQVQPIKTTVSSDSTDNEIQAQTKEILSTVKKQDALIEKEMMEIKKLLAISKASEDEGNIVYVGPQVEGLLQNTEKNLEWKMKSNALWTATFIYGALAITIPVLYTVFKGG